MHLRHFRRLDLAICILEVTSSVWPAPLCCLLVSFSTIMNGFIDMINEFKDYDAEISDGDNLTRFFGTVKKFNSDK
jgi:hypothetical protein